MRTASVERNTAETRISVTINLDGCGTAALASGVPFLDHMLDQIARHGLIDLQVKADGDLHIDAHHTVEDLVNEFFQGLVNHAQITLHVDTLRGDNAHHQCETVFKAFGRALRMAVEVDPRSSGVVPSTKGSL